MKGQDRAAFQYTLGFPWWSDRRPETPQKRDTHLKNEIGMSLGNRFLPPLIYIYIYIYIRACCEVILMAKFGHLKGHYLGQARVIIWAKFVFAL